MIFDLDALTIEDLTRGYITDDTAKRHICIVCGQAHEEGEIYPIDGRFYEARRAAALHQQAHGGRLAHLMGEENRHITLTDTQKTLFELFGAELSDAEIAQKTGVAASTVRSQRFAFREKARQAKMYLALYDLALGRRKMGKGDLIEVGNTARMVDERFVVTCEEREKILKNTFESLKPLKLKVLSAKEKKKIVILSRIAEEFERGRSYTEKEVNAVLAPIYEDHVMIRRYLIEYGFMERIRDGSRYWLK